MGISLSLVYKWAETPEEDVEDPGSGARNPLDRIEKLLASTRDRRIAQWICERAGGFFIANPETAAAASSSLIPHANSIVQEFADMLAVITAASADSEITQDEARKIRRRWEELKGVTEGFVHAAEKGNFKELKRG